MPLGGRCHAGPATAIDAAPEAIDIARSRVTVANVRFEVADVFSWRALARFDTVFFAFWLSHVPASRFEPFWRQLRGLVAAHGRVLLIDEHPDVRGKEDYAAGSDQIIRRRHAVVLPMLDTRPGPAVPADRHRSDQVAD